MTRLNIALIASEAEFSSIEKTKNTLYLVKQTATSFVVKAVASNLEEIIELHLPETIVNEMLQGKTSIPLESIYWKRLSRRLTPESFWQQGNGAFYENLYGNWRGLMFPTWSSTSAFDDFLLPSDFLFDPSNKLIPQISWAGLGDNAGKVCWGLEYVITRPHSGDCLTKASTTIYANTVLSRADRYRAKIQSFSLDNAIPASLLQQDCEIRCRVFRDRNSGQDTYEGNVTASFLSFYYLSKATGVSSLSVS